jgi:hypothetical protein
MTEERRITIKYRPRTPFKRFHARAQRGPYGGYSNQPTPDARLIWARPRPRGAHYRHSPAFPLPYLVD